MNHVECPLRGEIRWNGAMRKKRLKVSKRKDFTLLNRNTARLHTSTIYVDFFSIKIERNQVHYSGSENMRKKLTEDGSTFPYF